MPCRGEHLRKPLRPDSKLVTINQHGTFLNRSHLFYLAFPVSILLLMLLLLLLSRFSRARLCATPETAAHQAPQSLGFSRQEHWSGLSFPSPMHEGEKWKWSRSVVYNSYRPHGGSLPGSSGHGILQARVLEWGAIAFSDITVYKHVNVHRYTCNH